MGIFQNPTVISILAFIFILGAAVTLHEFGHFLVAKLLKIRVHYSSNQNLPRFGFVVSKKHAARIVDRNRLKRILRSTIRELEPSLTGSHDVIIQARPHVSRVPAKQIREELQILLEKAKLLKA